MVSRFSYPSFKQFDLDRRIKFVYMLLVPLFFVLIASIRRRCCCRCSRPMHCRHPCCGWGAGCGRLFRGRSGGRDALMDHARRNQYLQAIGVDVWVRAGASASVPAWRSRRHRSHAHAQRARRAGMRACRLKSLAVHQVRAAHDPHSRRVWCRQPRGAMDGHRRGAGRGRRPTGRALRRPRRAAAQRDARAIGLEREQRLHREHLSSAARRATATPSRRRSQPACRTSCARSSCCNPVMLAVGRIAAQNLLGTDAPFGRLRGKVHRFGELNTPLVVTYHPAYLLRTPGREAQGLGRSEVRA